MEEYKYWEQEVALDSISHILINKQYSVFKTECSMEGRK